MEKRCSFSRNKWIENHGNRLPKESTIKRFRYCQVVMRSTTKATERVTHYFSESCFSNTHVPTVLYSVEGENTFLPICSSLAHNIYNEESKALTVCGWFRNWAQILWTHISPSSCSILRHLSKEQLGAGGPSKQGGKNKPVVQAKGTKSGTLTSETGLAKSGCKVILGMFGSYWSCSKI